MSHTIREKAKLLARVRRVSGQLRALERSLEEERPCGEVLQLIAAARGAMNGLMGEVLEEHIRAHLGVEAKGRRPADAADELIGVVRTYLR